MLAPHEHRKLLDQLAHIPKSFTALQRKSFERTIRKKLKEHDYASTYQPFEPLPYELVFINRTTEIETLTRIINLIDDTTLFTLDTESTNILHQPNKPSLIQLQALQQETNSTIIFIEVCHLPLSNDYRFTLIKQLFNVLLQPSKIIYTWGEITELDSFTRYNLFTSDQITLPKPLNVQRRFRTYWSDTYPHKEDTNHDTTPCKCLYCFGITHDNLIAIQDAVAICLQQWIDKRLTRHPFDIGLDPHLQHLNHKEIETRQRMSAYAANDCDAVKQIIIYTNIIDEVQPPVEPQLSTLLLEVSPLNSPSNVITNDVPETIPEETSSQNDIPPSSFEIELEPISEDDDIIIPSKSTTNRIVTITEQSNVKQPPSRNLTLEQRKRLHNRGCTLRQRRRLYQHKITCYDIDSRFAVRKIKQMLDDYHVDFTAINKVKSQTTNTTILYVGVHTFESIIRYKPLLQTLFTTRNYNRIYNNNYNYPLL